MPTTEIVIALLLLLPGFLASRVFSSLIARRPPAQVERLIEALIFELVVVATYSILASSWDSLRPQELAVLANTESAKQLVADPLRTVSKNAIPFTALVVISIVVGFIGAVSYNFDFPWNLLRTLRLTKQSSRATVWESVFHSYTNYVIVHLTDGTRIIGWPRHFSDNSQEGELFLMNAAYLADTGDPADDIDISGPGILLTKAAGISHIEFLETKGARNEQEPQATDRREESTPEGSQA